MILFDWLNAICDAELPSDDIVAYNFGLFEGEDGYTLYLIGSSEYDTEDTDWATNNDFEPENKYCLLPAGEYSNLGWEQVLERVKSELTKFVQIDKFKNSFFSKAVAITIGFDDGDLERIV